MGADAGNAEEFNPVPSTTEFFLRLKRGIGGFLQIIRLAIDIGDLSNNVVSGGEHWNFLAFSVFRCGANSTRPIG
jgi:hypothetical protein